MTPMLRKIDSWRFERPLAVLLALSAGFMVLAMPARQVAMLPGAARLGALMQPLVASVSALLGGLIGLGVMAAAGGPANGLRRAPDAVDEDDDLDLHLTSTRTAEDIAAAAAAAAETSVRVRRADAHPDAPPRAPILAMRDLGEPPVAPAPEPAPDLPAILDADFFELPEPIAVDPAATADPASAGEPAPARSAAAPRAERLTIADLMARLDAGMAGRAAPATPPRDARPALRDALTELNRLAARRP